MSNPTSTADLRRLAAIHGIARGSRVWQPTYGCGTVTELDETHVRIDFDEHGSRLFVTSRVTLMPTRVPAPPAPTRTRRGFRRTAS